MGTVSKTDGSSVDTIYEVLKKRGVSRRDFLRFCSLMTATLALPSVFVSQIAEALETGKKPYLVWLEFQDCAGDTEALLRASKPTVAEILLDVLAVEYHETIMAAAGFQAEKSLQDVVRGQKGKYIAVVEGSIPLNDGGVYCCIGGRAASDIVKEVCTNAMATIAVGTCATCHLRWLTRGKSQPYRGSEREEGCSGDTCTKPPRMPCKRRKYHCNHSTFSYIRLPAAP